MTRAFGIDAFHAAPLLASTPATVVLTTHDGVVQLPSYEALVTSMYAHAGPDLIISTPTGTHYVIKGFFLSDHPPALSDGAGHIIAGEHVAQFAGPVTVGV